MFQRVRLIRGIALAAISFGVPAAAFADHPWLDDANRRSPTADASLDKLSHGYPRVLVHEFVSGVSAEAYSKYDFVDAHGTHFETFETVQSKYDGTTRMLRHISGRAYQSYNFGTCVISSGIAFEATTSASQGGPKSAGCGIFAGHWLYKAGTTTRQSIAAGATTIPVNDPSRITQGSYVVIYDAPAGSFRNAEHARVTGVNKTNNTIQVARGFKSKAASHAAGSIVAEHVIGQGSDKQLWAFNMSSQSAQDANGKTFGEFYADWIGKNLEKYGTGQQTSADVAGVMFDADFYYELANTKSDANNDLVVDNGLAPNGTNWLGEGLDAFYARVSNRLPGKYLLTGVHDGRGYHAAHGTQMENWLDFGNGDFKPTPKYNRIPDLFATYLFNMADRSSGPPL
ncbi:MAG TPA: hypothetical protein VFY03_00920, partial [Woeseiaceae bacterium]|nr:hypothetical protein [Woeseiaceae bacterium]